MKKWVYLFTEGNANMRELLGGKGANLAEMTNIGLPVPQGFTITTEACTQYYEDGREINEEIQGQINEYITKMEEITGKKFGDHENPLLVSVRSGARASMPGMMDTILNLGLNETVVNVIAEKSGNPRWAWDCYRRFIQLFLGIIREVYTDLSLVLSLELASQFLQIISSKLNVLLNTLLLFHCIDQLLEVLLTYFHNNVGIHLDKSSIAADRCNEREEGC